MDMTDPLVATFSLVARDPETGDLAVAVASKYLAVGSIVPVAVAGVGAMATQALANMSFGPRSMELLAAGATPEECAREFGKTDPAFQTRQFGLVTAAGDSFSHTGTETLSWAGGVTGPDFAAQGNILTGPEVVDALVSVWKQGELAFPERLLAALAAADEAGGDSRGRQAAALLVVGEGKGYGGNNDRWIDLRVDDHSDPVSELARLLDLYRLNEAASTSR